MPSRVDVLGRRRLYDGFFSLDVLELRHERYDGATSPTLIRELLVQRPAVAVLPWSPLDGLVVLVEQFRTGLLGEARPWSIEAVGGIIDDGENAGNAARREALEETGLMVRRLEVAGRYHSSPGVSSEMVRCFIGEVDAVEAPGVFGVAAEHEDIRTVVAPLAVAAGWVDDGTITSANTVIPLSWLLRHHDELRRRWLADIETGR